MGTAAEQKITNAVLKSLSGTKNRRLKQIMTSLVKHAHGFVRETELTEAEWWTAIQFLTRTGHMCDDRRQEFILLSDTLGVSMLVDAINHRFPAGATETTVLGPFYVKGAKILPHGANISRGTGGEPTFVSGRVRAVNGKPVAGAMLDVWQTAPNGMYDLQDPNQPDMNLRGRFRTDREGRFHFRTVKPVSYPIPHDGPVGKMLGQLGRHPYRPAHLHFIVTAKGYHPVTTHLFVKGDPYLGSDAVFGVKRSLIANYVKHTRAAERAKYGVKTPFYTLNYAFGLKPLR
jgi:protocatechuate 3,4-dioxygenase beta subunit